MSDADGMPSPAALAQALADEIQHLTPDDRALVIALVGRLRGQVAEGSAYPRDVTFMDFDE